MSSPVYPFSAATPGLYGNSPFMVNASLHATPPVMTPEAALGIHLHTPSDTYQTTTPQAQAQSALTPPVLSQPETIKSAPDKPAEIEKPTAAQLVAKDDSLVTPAPITKRTTASNATVRSLQALKLLGAAMSAVVFAKVMKKPDPMLFAGMEIGTTLFELWATPHIYSAQSGTFAGKILNFCSHLPFGSHQQVEDMDDTDRRQNTKPIAVVLSLLSAGTFALYNIFRPAKITTLPKTMTEIGKASWAEFKQVVNTKEGQSLIQAVKKSFGHLQDYHLIQKVQRNVWLQVALSVGISAGFALVEGTLAQSVGAIASIFKPKSHHHHAIASALSPAIENTTAS